MKSSQLLFKKNYIICTIQLHNFFEKHCVFFTLIDSLIQSHYSVHKSIEIQLSKNE